MSTKGLSRRKFLELQLCGGAFLALAGTPALAFAKRSGRATPTKVLVLGLDGMDPRIVRQMMDDGRLPTFTKVARQGYFGPLGTSRPPQSPVAWSNFIAGCNPGGHGIFDFMHRYPETYLPYLSTAGTEGSSKTVRIGGYVLPLASAKVIDLRRGRALWEILEEHDIPATVFKMPANYPPTPTRQRTFSGMGTPDLLGSYGTFSYYTDEPVFIDPDLGGGTVHDVWLEDDTFSAQLIGPVNTFRKDAPDVRIELKVYRDPDNPVARIDVAGQELILRQGEWSRWVELEFPLVPGVSVTGICRFFLKQVRPAFRLYVTPINIDPANPAQPLSTPEDYALELADRFGPFSTKGLPADTHALAHGVLDEADFLAMDHAILQDDLAILDFELERFSSGMLFFYVSSTDQRAHMFWRLRDPQHPAHDPKLAREFGGTLESTYEEMDRLVDHVLGKIDRDTMLLVVSDHGFNPYYRSFHLNSWLVDNGYLALRDPRRRGQSELFRNVDWSATRAYALGFNALYVNQAGREGQGIVPAAEAPALLDQIGQRLVAERDPLGGQAPVLRADAARDCYRGPYVAIGPDLVIGYNRGYRASWETALGKAPLELYETNTGKWSGDHMMAAEILPGILLSNRPLKNPANATLCDATATVLAALGVPLPAQMEGRPLL